MIKSIKSGYSVKEIPTVLKTRKYGVSKMNVAKTIYAHLQILTKLVFKGGI
jgi:hypothetical protein